MSGPRTTHAALALLAAIVALALALRLEGLDARTIAHPECYVPRLDFRPPFDSPAPRPTLHATLQRTIDDDNHPPFQLVLMYAWTGLAGTELAALRLPSAVFGALGVLLLFLFARRTDGERTALLASTLFALNGLHVFWSQRAQIWVLVCAIGTASLWLLAGLLARPTRARALGYVAACALGLWTEYYFWPFLAAQVLFVLVQRPGPDVRGLLRLQVAALLFATPMAVFLWSHTMHRRHFVVPRTLPRVVEVLAGNGLVDQGLATSWLGGAGVAAFGVAACCGLALLVLATRRAPEAARSSAAVPPLRGLLVAAVATSTAVLAAMQGAGLAKPHWLALAALLAPAGLVAWWFVERSLPRLEPARAEVARGLAGRLLGRDLAASSFWTPLVLLVAVSAVKPMLLARGLLILAPAAAILLSRATLSLGSRPRRLALGAVLLAVAALSAHHGKTQVNGPADFAALGRELARLTRPGETIVVKNKWPSQPVLYYVDQDRNPATTPERALDALERGERPERLWFTVFRIDDEKTDESFAELRAELAPFGYEAKESARVFGAAALSFERRP